MPVDSKPRTPREPLWNLIIILLILVFLISRCKTGMVGDLLNLPWVGKKVKRNRLFIVNLLGAAFPVCAYMHTHTKSSIVP